MSLDMDNRPKAARPYLKCDECRNIARHMIGKAPKCDKHLLRRLAEAHKRGIPVTRIEVEGE